MRKLVREKNLERHIEVESAGTAGWHAGSPPDRRSHAAAARRGIALESVAQQFTAGSFARFSLVLAADAQNRRDLESIAPDAEARAKIRLLRDFDSRAERGASVPDPYYGGPNGFEEVLDICEAACRGLLEQLERQLDGTVDP